jgi:CheY-like chemotaxis protein
MLPDMTGMELHARITAMDPGLAARTVFHTGGAYTDAAREFLERVENPQLSKPFDPAELLRLVAERVGPGKPPA